MIKRGGTICIYKSPPNIIVKPLLNPAVFLLADNRFHWLSRFAFVLFCSPISDGTSLSIELFKFSMLSLFDYSFSVCFAKGMFDGTKLFSLSSCILLSSSPIIFLQSKKPNKFCGFLTNFFSSASAPLPTLSTELSSAYMWANRSSLTLGLIRWYHAQNSLSLLALYMSAT